MSDLHTNIATAMDTALGQPTSKYRPVFVNNKYQYMQKKSYRQPLHIGRGHLFAHFDVTSWLLEVLVLAVSAGHGPEFVWLTATARTVSAEYIGIWLVWIECTMMHSFKVHSTVDGQLVK